MLCVILCKVSTDCHLLIRLSLSGTFEFRLNSDTCIQDDIGASPMLLSEFHIGQNTTWICCLATGCAIFLKKKIKIKNLQPAKCVRIRVYASVKSFTAVDTCWHYFFSKFYTHPALVLSCWKKYVPIGNHNKMNFFPSFNFQTSPIRSAL